MNMKKDFFNKINFSSLNLKIFWLSFIPVFVIVILQHIGVRPPELNIFSSVKTNLEIRKNIWETIKSKLNKNKNLFNLQKNTSFVPRSFASSYEDYENANAYLVFDYDTGNVITSKNINTKLPIASLTKVATAVVALDLADKNELFTVSEKAAAITPTKIGVVPYEKMSLYELLNALLLTSANDAAWVIKEGIDYKYGEEVFIKAMNEKAKFLKLRNTNFENPMGFDGLNHYSSVEDLAILTRYALEQYPVISEIVKKDYVYLPQNINHKQFDLYNWNGLINVYPNVMGVKIGNTDDAGHTSIVMAERKGKKLLAVILGAPGVLERDLWISNLLDYGFEITLGLPRIFITEEQLFAKYNTWQYFN